MYVVVYGIEVVVGTFAGRLGARPHLVPLAAPHGIADQHITIVALVGNERVVRD